MHPGRIGRLVIVDTIMLMPMDRVKNMNEFGARPAKGYATQEELIARYRLEPAETQMAAREAIERMALYSGRRDSDGLWRHKADRAVYSRFQQIAGIPLWEKVQVPALVIKGERSKRFMPDVLAEVRARAPQVQLVEVPASDHHIMLDNPLGFIEAVRTFLRTA
jgi:pimeloyl-ACP methyl ester carboxylesterase